MAHPKMTPDFTAARAQRAAQLGYAVLVVQLRGGMTTGSAISDDVQTRPPGGRRWKR